MITIDQKDQINRYIADVLPQAGMTGEVDDKVRRFAILNCGLKDIGDITEEQMADLLELFDNYEPKELVTYIDTALGEPAQTTLAVVEAEPDASSTSLNEVVDGSQAHLDQRYNDYVSYLCAIFKPGDTLCFVAIEHNETNKENERIAQTFCTFEDAVTRQSFEVLRQVNDAWSTVQGNTPSSIYVAMNTYPSELSGQRAGRTQQNVVAVRALQADIDVDGMAIAFKMDTSAAIPPAPIRVESSTGKFQGIWPVDGIAKEDAKPLMQAIAQAFGTDTSVAEIARVMRVPGFYNRKPKYNPQPLAKLVRNDQRRHNRSDFKVELLSTNTVVPERTAFDLEQPFIHGRLDNQIVAFIGHYMAADNIKNPATLYDLLEKRIQDNGCFEPDGVTPFGCDMNRVRELCELKSREWKTGEEKRKANDLPMSGQTATDKEQLLQKKRQEFDALVDEAQREQERETNPYPVEAWQGTPYYDFAKVCTENNLMPVEYFINGMITTVGAICGNRMTPVFNPTLEARFITLLMSKRGGIGKNTVFEWCEKPFEDTNLISRHTGLQIGSFQKIGCYTNSFASGRGMADTMVRHPRILQRYGEFTTLLEKFGIAGSGDAFRDAILNMADSQIPEWGVCKGFKVPPDAPKAVSNSVLAGTTEERYEEIMSKINMETFVQRMNIVPSEEEGTVFMLTQPDLVQFKPAFVPRVTLLDTYRFVWSLTADAKQVGEAWYRQTMENLADDAESTEAMGRIQVFLFRIISHMAFWQAPLPPDIRLDPTMARPDLEWQYEVGADIMRRAIQVAEHQIRARLTYTPTRGTGDMGLIENAIKKWAFKHKKMRWVELRRRSKIARYGLRRCWEALRSVEDSRVITVVKNPDDEKDERDWVVMWVGSQGNHRKWKETRGGRRVNPQTGKGYRSGE